jgi:putative DNA primase/helicase
MSNKLCYQTIAEQLASKNASKEIKNGFNFTAVHVYTDAKGLFQYMKVRLKHPDGRKWIRPFYQDISSGQWIMKEPPFPNDLKPLYDLSSLISQAGQTVWIVEGETKVEMLKQYGIVATTSGSGDSISCTDWEPLREKEVILWRDNDSTGERWQTVLVTTLRALNCQIHCIDVEFLNLSEGADVIDWVESQVDVLTPSDFLTLPMNTKCREQIEINNTFPTKNLAIVECVRARDIIPEPIKWLWKEWLAMGKFHILGGAPGTGKTTIAMDFAAVISNGGLWPDETRATIGNVLIWSGEDDPQDTLVPRLILAGANMDNIYFIQDVIERGTRRIFNPACDMEVLWRKMEAMGNVRLLIIDPIVSSISGDSHKNAEVRRDLQPIVDLAGHMGCVILGITHFAKGSNGRDPLERIIGSIAFGAVARVVMVAAKQENSEDTTRLLVRAKSNIGHDQGGFKYQIEQTVLPQHPEVDSIMVKWGQKLEGTAKELLERVRRPESGNHKSLLQEAVDFLKNILANGAILSTEVFTAAESVGFSKATIRRAKDSLDIEVIKIGVQWAWKMITVDKDDRSEKVSILSTFPSITKIIEGDEQDTQGAHEIESIHSQTQ